MGEDILERAKKALIDDDMTYEDYDECISLLIAEVERLQAVLGAWQENSGGWQAEAEKWKAKAIEERAIADFGGESEGQDYHIDFAKIPDEGEDDIAFGDVYIPTSKRGWKAQAARELEEEMKHV